MSAEAKSRKSCCLDDLRVHILTLEFEPGEYLDEVQLSEKYNISRPPLREVLNQLAGEEYVVLHKNRGAQVAPLSLGTLRNFFVVAPMIYAAVNRLAAENANRAQIMRLKDAQLLFRAAIRDGDAAQRALSNQRFHEIIGEMAGNEYLMPSLRRLLIDHTRIGMTFYAPGNRALAQERAIAADQHDQFIAAIEAGDANLAARLSDEHWELSRAQIESFVTPTGMDISLGQAPGKTDAKGAL